MAYSGVIPDGVYRIVSTMDTGINFDVAGGSGAIGANLQLWGDTDHLTNTQLFWVECISGSDATLYSIRSYFTGFSITCEGDQPTSNVTLRPLSTGSGQQWRLVQRNAAQYNGVNVPCYLITSVLAPGLSLDACAAQSTPGTNVWLYNTTQKIDGWGQLWLFIPEEPYVKALPVASDLKLECDGIVDSVAEIAGAGSFKPSWIGVNGSWQMRYRYRLRNVGKADSWRTAWTGWHSFDDRADYPNCLRNGGWGDPGVPNCTTERAGDRTRTATAVSRPLYNTAGQPDLCEFEYEVRRCSTDHALPFSDWYGAQRTISVGGGVAAGSCKAAYKPTVTVGQVAFSPLGLMVGLSSNFARTGNKYSVAAWLSNGKRVAYKHTEANQDASCTVVIPAADLVRVPSDGQLLRIGWSLTTRDGAVVKGEALDKECSYDAGGGISVTATMTEDRASGMLSVSVSSPYNGSMCWVVTEDETVYLGESASGSFDVYYPLGVPFEVFGITYDDLETRWDTWHQSFAARTSSDGSGYLFSFDGGSCLIKYGLDDPPEWTCDSTMDYTAELTTGREFDAVRVGRARSEEIGVSGVLLHGRDGGSYKDFQALKACRFAWLRDGFGHVWRVAVIGASEKRKRREWSEVSVTVRREL